MEQVNQGLVSVPICLMLVLHSTVLRVVLEQFVHSLLRDGLLPLVFCHEAVIIRQHIGNAVR